MERRGALGIAGGAFLCLLTVAALAVRARQTPEIDPLPESRVLKTVSRDNVVYFLVDDGRVYRRTGEGKRWSYVDTVFDTKEIANTYTRDGDVLYRVDPASRRRYPVRQAFHEDFEGLASGVAGLRQLIGEQRMWTEVTLQSPRTPTVPAYVDLRNRILAGNSDFLDGRVEPTTEQVHSGKASLKCVCPAKSPGMVCSKASLSTGIIHFTRGQDVWFRAWYRIDGPVRPLTLVDLEDSLVKESPGIRVMLFEDGDLGAELKSLEKPTFRQTPDRRKAFPMNRWVEVIWQIHLDDGPTGRVRLWQDGDLVVNGSGPTLPFAPAIYNSLEVGISAHSRSDQPTTLYVDDIQVTTRPLVKETLR